MLEPALFLPFLVAWPAFRLACSPTALWLWLGVLAASGFDYSLADSLSIGPGVSTVFMLFAVAAACTFSRPAALRAFAETVGIAGGNRIPDGQEPIALLPGHDPAPELLTAGKAAAFAHVAAIRGFFRKCTGDELAEPVSLWQRRRICSRRYVLAPT